MLILSFSSSLSTDMMALEIRNCMIEAMNDYLQTQRSKQSVPSYTQSHRLFGEKEYENIHAYVPYDRFVELDYLCQHTAGVPRKCDGIRAGARDTWVNLTITISGPEICSQSRGTHARFWRIRGKKSAIFQKAHFLFGWICRKAGISNTKDESGSILPGTESLRSSISLSRLSSQAAMCRSSRKGRHEHFIQATVSLAHPHGQLAHHVRHGVRQRLLSQRSMSNFPSSWRTAISSRLLQVNNQTHCVHKW